MGNNTEDYSDSDPDPIDEDEDEITDEKTICLFCNNMYSSLEIARRHLENSHGFYLSKFKSKFNMDQYSYIKLINYIRLEKPKLDDILVSDTILWRDEKYLRPLEYEPWLIFDFEDLPSEPIDTSKMKPVSGEEYMQLKNVCSELNEKVKDSQQLLAHATESVQKMRNAYHRLLESDTETKENCVSSVSLGADEGYFNSYSHFGIHHEMLSDTVRTISYRDSLLKNKQFVNGKTVLDLGCGTSVLSIFASQAGAEQVVAVDNSDIIYNAMDIVKKNKIYNINFIKGRLEDTTLPLEKFDIIISEWMGYFLLFEGMLDSVIYARNKYLSDEGILMPNRCTMSIVGYGDEALYNKHITFWDSVYGLDMSTMKKEVLREPLIEVVSADNVLTEPNVIADLDLATVSLNYSNFSYDFNLKCVKDGRLSSFVGYFDTYFGKLPNPVEFSTSPFAEPTHWKQVVFFLENSKKVKAGEVVSGKLVCRRSTKSMRSLDVNIIVFGKQNTYYLD